MHPRTDLFVFRRSRICVIAVAAGAILSMSAPVSAQCVEGCNVIHTFIGENPGDQFGWVSNSIGDVDGDGVQDCVISATTYIGAGATGKIYVYSGKLGTLKWSRAADPGMASLGYDVANAGDVNGDGINDVIAGAPSGAIPRAVVYDGTSGGVIHQFNGLTGYSMGYDVNGGGDYNGDGVNDIVIGAATDSTIAANQGRVYIYSSNGFTPIGTIDGLSAGERFGSAAEFIGDINGDGRDDIGVGAFGGTNAYVFGWDGTQSQLIWTLPANTPTSAYGQWFLNGGDVNGDGTNDIYVGDYAASRAHVFSGATGVKLWTFAQSGGFGIGRIVDDVDGDGGADMVFAAWAHSSGAPQGGKAFVYSGKTGAILETFTHNVANANFGFDSNGMGDVDGDGKFDYLITAASDSGSTGKAYIIAGTIGAPVCYADCDGNTTLNIFDYICFGNAYSMLDPYADCDANAMFNIFDYICFGNAYANGCP